MDDKGQKAMSRVRWIPEERVVGEAKRRGANKLASPTPEAKEQIATCGVRGFALRSQALDFQPPRRFGCFGEASAVLVRVSGTKRTKTWEMG